MQLDHKHLALVQELCRRLPRFASLRGRRERPSCCCGGLRFFRRRSDSPTRRDPQSPPPPRPTAGGALASAQELNFEKAKTLAQGRELAQALAQARDAIHAESVARRQDVALAVKGLEELIPELQDSGGWAGHRGSQAPARPLRCLGHPSGP